MNGNSNSSASTPGLEVPGSYPSDPASQSNALARTPSRGGAKDAMHHTAEAYIAPERLDQVEHLVEGVGHKAAQYVPAGVASGKQLLV
jgi:hypothetical protein